MTPASAAKMLALALHLVWIVQASSDVCTNPGCRKASSDILSFIDASVDPCQDFFRFTCGGIFKKTFEAKPASLGAMAKKEVQDQTSVMIIKPADPKEPRAVQALKKFFRACMDEASVEKYGLTSLKRALGMLGGWPVLGEWSEDDFNLEELLVKMRKMGYDFTQLISVRTTVDKEGLSFMIEEPPLETVRHRFKENYHDYMVNVSVLLGADRRSAALELQEMLMFKMKLIEILEKQDKFNRTTIGGLQEQHSFIDWTYLVESIVNDGRRVLEKDPVYVPAGGFLGKLEELLKETSNRTLANYIVWEAIEDMAPYFPKDFRDATQFYVQSNSNVTEEEHRPRLEFCKKQASKVLKPTFEALYVREHFHWEKRQPVHEITSKVMEEFLEFLNRTTLDEETKEELLARGESLAFTIGAPEDVFDEHLLGQIMDEDVSLNSNDFLTMASVLNRQSANHAVRLGIPYDYYDEFYAETVVPEAAYDPSLNSLALPAALLQGLFFDENRPQYLNFGTIGATLAYKLSQSFLDKDDCNNSIFDSLFSENKPECLVQLANKFHIENSNLQMNGQKILPGMVYDTLGVNISYHAYESWIMERGEEKLLPGLSYSGRQLFWIATASRFCDTISLDDLGNFIRNGDRAHPTFRTFSALSNNAHFGEDFECSAGTRMNPHNKCMLF